MRVLRRLIARRRVIGLIIGTNFLFVLYIYWGFASNDSHRSPLGVQVVSDMERLAKNRPWDDGQLLNPPIISEKSLKFNEHLFFDDKDFADGTAKLTDLGSCDKLTPPDVRSLSDKKFLAVDESSRETFVVSAYYDPRIRGRAQIRIIGMSSGSGDTTKFCQVWYPQDTKVHLFPAAYELIPETHERKYAPSFHVCSMPKRSPLPYAVSLVEGKCDEPRHYLKVIINSAGPVRSEPRLNFTVCVTPLNFHFDNTHQLVEMIEMNRLLGADRLVFYNHTSGAALTRYLSYYTSVLGVTDVIQWDVPVPVDVWPPDPHLEPPQIHYFAQLVALNDCLFRYMFVSRYVVFTDLDEFVVPQQVSSWSDLLPSLPCDQSATGAFSFMCTFFRMDWPDYKPSSEDATISKLKLNTLLKIQREDKIWPHFSRSKVIVKPEKVVQIGIHFVYEFIRERVVQCEVSERDALLHHYRLWEDEDTERVEDRRMLAYKDQLVARCLAVHQSVMKTQH